MKQLTKLHIVNTPYSGDFIVSTFDLSDADGYILHDTIEVELEFNTLSEKEVTAVKVAQLRKGKAELLQKAEEIEDKIQSLMALEAPVAKGGESCV